MLIKPLVAKITNQQYNKLLKIKKVLSKKGGVNLANRNIIEIMIDEYYKDIKSLKISTKKAALVVVTKMINSVIDPSHYLKFFSIKRKLLRQHGVEFKTNKVLKAMIDSYYNKYILIK